MVTFSVVVPNKNRTDLLYRAVRSVLSQSFDDVEIIIVDDSNSDIFDQIKKHFSTNPRVLVIKGDSSGESWARKKGFEVSSGKYVALLDSDDYWNPDKLMKHYKTFLSDSRIGVTWDKLIDVNEISGITSYIEPPVSLSNGCDLFNPTLIKLELAKANFIHASCGIVDKSKLDGIGGFPPIRPSDYMLWLKLSEFFYFALVPYYLTTKFFNITSMGTRKILLYQDMWNSFPMRFRFVIESKKMVWFKKFFMACYLISLLSGVTLLMKDKTKIIFRKLLNKSF